MAVASKRRAWGERESSEISPERTKVWMEPKVSTLKKVPVVYYLTRNGHLEHPHFMEVTLAYGEGLYLRDVINRLNLLRGKGMACLYSWSSKRSYKNGFVWHDLTEDDFIYPAHGTEYVLKGSEILLLQENTSPSRSQDTTTSAASSSGSEEMIPKSSRDDTDFPVVRRKESRWSSFDLGEYKVYKTESTTDVAIKATNASTQTDERMQWRRRAPSLPRDDGRKMEEKGNSPVQLGRNDISSRPPSSSSPEIIDDLIKADLSRNAVELDLPVDDQDRTVGICPSGRARASAVLINMISCGSISVKEHQGNGLPFVSHYRPKAPTRCCLATNPIFVGKEALVEDESRRFPSVRIEDKEYFSGSLIETKKMTSDGYEELPSLKRSSSYNADQSSKLDIEEKEENVRAKCIPRKPKTGSLKKETSSFISRSAHGSKRITEEVQTRK